MALSADTVNKLIRESFNGDPVGRYQEIQRALCSTLNVAQLTAPQRKLVTSCIQEWRVHAAKAQRQRELQAKPLKRFTVVMAYSDDYPVGKLCESVNRAYASKHGYDFVVHCLPAAEIFAAIRPKEHCTWYKVKVINDLLESCRDEDSVAHYILWVDADAVVINMEKPLDEFVVLGEGRELIIGEDMSSCSLINAGLFLVRACEFSKGLFRELWDSPVLAKYDSQTFYEQSALIWLLKRRREGFETVEPFHYHNGGPLVKQFPHVCVLAKHLFNSNICLQSGKRQDPPAEFVFHPAGSRSKLTVLRNALDLYGVRYSS